MKYVMRRLLRVSALFVGVSVLCFLFTQLAPGSFFDELRLNPQISPQTIATLRAHYGLDQPLALRYIHWLTSVASGDFGYSVAYNAPVAPMLIARARNTLLLSTAAMILTWLLGVPLGILAAARRGRILDKVVAGSSSLLVAVPEIVLGVALLALAVRTRILPAGGMSATDFDALSGWGKLHDVLLRLVLPTSILVLSSVAIITRHIRASVLEVLDAPFIRAARGLGISSGRLLFRHVLPVAASPAISLFGFSIATLLSGSLLVEVITGWPGLGPLILEATFARDLYVVIGGVMFSTAFMLMGNFIADLMLLACDPRIRTGGQDEN
jgi:peptide/nickel transport system permease protein